MSTDLTPRIALIALAAFFAGPAHAQQAAPGQPPPNAVSVEKSAVFDVRPASGALKEKITFSGHVSAFGWRPESDPQLEVIVRTRGGASIYFWNFAVSVRCADSNRPLPPLSQVVPNDIAANLFNNVGTVEISEYREPNAPILSARQCPS
jgi:hypothetical protein